MGEEIQLLVEPIYFHLAKAKANFFSANILHAIVLGQHYIILNSLEDAEELFERRARIYSDRPESPIVNM